MVILKKQILNYKIQSIIAHNPFLIFFQFNNVNTKEWRLIKSKLSKITNTPILVVKNKIVHKIFSCTDKSFSISQQTDWRCETNSQGAQQSSTTTEVTKGNFKPVKFFTKNKQQATANLNKLNNILNDNLVAETPDVCLASLEKNNFTNRQTKFVYKSNLTKFPKTVFQGPTLMLGFVSLKQLQDIYEILNETPNFMFVGGLFQNQIINHLDLDKIVKLDSFVYENLLKKCLNCSELFFFLKNLINFKVLTSVQENLLHVLTSYTNQLKSEKSKTLFTCVNETK